MGLTGSWAASLHLASGRKIAIMGRLYTTEELELYAAAKEMLLQGEHEGECTNDENGPCWKHIEISAQRENRLRDAIKRWEMENGQN